MKKFLSLLTVVAILFTVSVMPAFAAEYSAVYKVEGDTGEIGDIITVTLTYKGASQVYMLQGYLNFDQTVVAPALADGTVITYKADGTATKTNAKKAIVSSLIDASHESGDYEGEAVWGQENIAADKNAGKFGIMLCVEGSDSDSTLYDVSAEGFEFYTLRLVRLTEGNINLKLDTTLATKMETSNASGDVIKGNVTIDYTAPGGSTGGEGGEGGEDPDPEDPEDPTPSTPTYEASKEDVGGDSWSAVFKYTTELNGTANEAGYAGKKVAAFGKAGTALTSGNYGVKFGNRFYPGRIDVEAGKFFAIVIINSADAGAIKDGYTYQVYTGNVEATGGEANAQFVTDALAAVVE